MSLNPDISQAERRRQPMIQKILRRIPSGRAATGSRAEIARRWVETADERCPLACVWFALPEAISDQDDEPRLRWPAFSFSKWKAGYLHLIHTFPAPFTLA
jgi:hypothetical protein